MPRAVTSPHSAPRKQQIPLTRDPTRRTWRRSNGPYDGGGGRLSAPVMRLRIPRPDLMRGMQTAAQESADWSRAVLIKSRTAS
jgi:hypothetical protein